jgi:hypothetical protein
MYKDYYLALLPFNLVSLILSILAIIYLLTEKQKSHFKYLLLTQIGNITTQIITITLSVIFSRNPDFDYYGIRNDNLINLLMTFLARVNVLFIVLTSIRVLSTFKVLTDTITSKTIKILTIISTTTFILVNIPIWIIIILNSASIPHPQNLTLISNSCFSAWLLIAIIYEDIQALYLARLIYLFNKQNHKTIVKKSYTLTSRLIIFTCVIDWLGLGLYISFMTNEEGLQLVNQVIVSLPGIHGVIKGWVLVVLTRLVFMGRSGEEKTMDSTGGFTRNVGSFGQPCVVCDGGDVGEGEDDADGKNDKDDEDGKNDEDDADGKRNQENDDEIGLEYGLDNIRHTSKCHKNYIQNHNTTTKSQKSNSTSRGMEEIKSLPRRWADFWKDDEDEKSKILEI